jgi:hypothetical protein
MTWHEDIPSAVHVFRHGPNPEAVLRISRTIFADIDDENLRLGGMVCDWLSRVHGPRPWETEAEVGG